MKNTSKKLGGAVTLLAAAAIAAGAAQAAGPRQSIGKTEGRVDIVAWPGYIERGATDKKFDWVTSYEKATGCKLVDIPTPDGKLTPALVEPRIRGLGDQHHVQPRVISISQSTELGTVYTPEEIRALADLAHRHGLYLHMDGARISNAAAALGVPLRAITTECGVDVLSFGGTKIGLMMGEAVVVFGELVQQSIEGHEAEPRRHPRGPDRLDRALLRFGVLGAGDEPRRDASEGVSRFGLERPGPDA